MSPVRDSRKTQGIIIAILTDFDAVGRPAGMIRPGHVHHSIVRFYPLTDCTNLYFFHGTMCNIMLIAVRVLPVAF